jgi:hypothetical protein
VDLSLGSAEAVLANLTGRLEPLAKLVDLSVDELAKFPVRVA